MRNKTSTAGLVAIALLFLSLMAVNTSAQNATNVHAINVGQGEKQKIQGVVSIRNGDSFKVRDTSGGETTVLLSSDTDVTSHARGLRGKKEYPVTYIMRGLRVQAQGRGDADGNLVAEWVRFDEQDLRSAQALEQTAELAVDNDWSKRLNSQWITRRGLLPQSKLPKRRLRTRRGWQDKLRKTRP
jgi:hypothetical protein